MAYHACPRAHSLRLFAVFRRSRRSRHRGVRPPRVRPAGRCSRDCGRAARRLVAAVDGARSAAATEQLAETDEIATTAGQPAGADRSPLAKRLEDEQRSSRFVRAVPNSSGPALIRYRAACVARRLDRRGRHGALVHCGEVADRLVPRQERRDIRLRRGRLDGRSPCLVYYSAQIFLLGAEFTWIYAHTYGSRRGERRPRPQDSAPVAPHSPSGPAPTARADYRREQSR